MARKARTRRAASGATADDDRPLETLEETEQAFFAENITYSIIVVANLITRNTDLRTLRDHDLGINEWRILRMVHMFGPISAADVIATIGMDKTTISRTITRLHGAGLVALEPNPADRRRTLLTLTQRGRRLHDRILPVDEAYDASFDEQLTDTERRHFVRAMAKLRAHGQQLLAAGHKRRRR